MIWVKTTVGPGCQHCRTNRHAHPYTPPLTILFAFFIEWKMVRKQCHLVVGCLLAYCKKKLWKLTVHPVVNVAPAGITWMCFCACMCVSRCISIIPKQSHVAQLEVWQQHKLVCQGQTHMHTPLEKHTHSPTICSETGRVLQTCVSQQSHLWVCVFVYWRRTQPYHCTDHLLLSSVATAPSFFLSACLCWRVVLTRAEISSTWEVCGESFILKNMRKLSSYTWQHF